MQRENEDEAWRAIVENYGDRVDLGTHPPEARSGTRPEAEPGVDDAWQDPWDDAAATGADSSYTVGPVDPVGPVPREEPDDDLQRADDEAYVPPPPPPLPRPTRDRLIAWVGVFGSPSILLVALVAGIALPTWLGYLLVTGFVGGFLYLVVQMPRGPRDPFDDGARL